MNLSDFVVLVNTLDELNSVVLRHMGVIGGATSVRRVAYRLLNLFPPNQFKYKIFWVEGDQHVRGMFELHRKYGSLAANAPQRQRGVEHRTQSPAADTLAQIQPHPSTSSASQVRASRTGTAWATRSSPSTLRQSATMFTVL
ncbi:hypothetical protein PIB30_055926 [Stylosanthes scabra]|uniref:Uncharacterized protein n=1 Tax=Stylosanthes scabra TaxID=79078 RepID=A0ABU6VK77_9FABA|nr:hypothetical protein [Stylosanthes scabra]